LAAFPEKEKKKKEGRASPGTVGNVDVRKGEEGEGPLPLKQGKTPQWENRWKTKLELRRRKKERKKIRIYLIFEKGEGVECERTTLSSKGRGCQNLSFKRRRKKKRQALSLLQSGKKKKVVLRNSRAARLTRNQERKKTLPKGISFS